MLTKEEIPAILAKLSGGTGVQSRAVKKKICRSERKGLTNRGELVIIAKLLSGTGVRQLGSGKRFRKKSKKGLDKSERVWYNDRAI